MNRADKLFALEERLGNLEREATTATRYLQDFQKQLDSYESRLMAFFNAQDMTRKRVEALEEDLGKVKTTLTLERVQKDIDRTQKSFDEKLAEMKKSLGPKLQEEIEKRKRLRNERL